MSLLKALVQSAVSLRRTDRPDIASTAGGTTPVLKALLQGCETDPASLMQAFAALPLPAALRHSALVSLHAAIKVHLKFSHRAVV